MFNKRVKKNVVLMLVLSLMVSVFMPSQALAFTTVDDGPIQGDPGYVDPDEDPDDWDDYLDSIATPDPTLGPDIYDQHVIEAKKNMPSWAVEYNGEAYWGNGPSGDPIDTYVDKNGYILDRDGKFYGFKDQSRKDKYVLRLEPYMTTFYGNAYGATLVEIIVPDSMIGHKFTLSNYAGDSVHGDDIRLGTIEAEGKNVNVFEVLDWNIVKYTSNFIAPKDSVTWKVAKEKYDLMVSDNTKPHLTQSKVTVRVGVGCSMTVGIAGSDYPVTWRVKDSSKVRLNDMCCPLNAIYTNKKGVVRDGPELNKQCIDIIGKKKGTTYVYGRVNGMRPEDCKTFKVKVTIKEANTESKEASAVEDWIFNKYIPKNLNKWQKLQFYRNWLAESASYGLGKWSADPSTKDRVIVEKYSGHYDYILRTKMKKAGRTTSADMQDSISLFTYRTTVCGGAANTMCYTVCDRLNIPCRYENDPDIVGRQNHAANIIKVNNKGCLIDTTGDLDDAVPDRIMCGVSSNGVTRFERVDEILETKTVEDYLNYYENTNSSINDGLIRLKRLRSSK